VQQRPRLADHDQQPRPRRRLPLLRRETADRDEQPCRPQPRPRGAVAPHRQRRPVAGRRHPAHCAEDRAAVPMRLRMDRADQQPPPRIRLPALPPRPVSGLDTRTGCRPVADPQSVDGNHCLRGILERVRLASVSGRDPSVWRPSNGEQRWTTAHGADHGACPAIAGLQHPAAQFIEGDGGDDVRVRKPNITANWPARTRGFGGDLSRGTPASTGRVAVPV
jgi:hypothetical protein